MVQEVWAIVAEDYAPFDVDVTTADPGYDGLVRTGSLDTTYGTRVLVSPSDDAFSKICNSGCGGVAYLDVYDEVGTYYQPAWVFPQALGDDAKNVAEAASHEAGHNLGLSHDGTATLGYYRGHGNWAPIMGVGYYSPLSQWSHGSYPGANNSAQDDIAVLTGYLGQRTDEAPGSSATPAPLPTGAAFITDASDVDTFLLGSCTSGSVVAVAPALLAPNLDVRAVLRDAGGTVVATAEPMSGFGDGITATGVDASLTVPTSGTGWTVSVEGVGEGGWSSSGYDDYGSLGAYTVSAPGCGDTVVGVPSAPQTPTAGSALIDRLTLGWAAPADPGTSPITGYVVSRTGTTQTWSLPATARTHQFLSLAAGTSYDLSVRAVNAVGAGPAATVTASTVAPPGAVPSAPRDLTGWYDADAGGMAVSWAAPTSPGSQPITGYTVYLDGERLGQLGATSRGITLTRPAGFTDGSYVVGVAAVNAVGESVVATATVVVDVPDDVVPDAPTLLSLVPGNGSATATWTAPADHGSPITGYTVVARSLGFDPRATAVSAPSTSVTLPGLANDVTWSFTVTATSAAGTSAASQPLTVTPTGVPLPPTPPPPTTPPTPPTTTPPTTTPPTGATARPTRMAAPRVRVRGRKAVVRWAAATSPGSTVTAYRVDLSKGRDRSATGGARKVVLARLKPGTYKVRVAALNAAGWSRYSRWVKVRVR